MQVCQRMVSLYGAFEVSTMTVRVHPAPFSPTPNRHAGIGLKMKGRKLVPLSFELKQLFNGPCLSPKAPS